MSVQSCIRTLFRSAALASTYLVDELSEMVLCKLVVGSDPPGNREFPKSFFHHAAMIRTAFSSFPVSILRRAIRHPTRFASSTTTEAAQKKAQDALGTAQKQAEQLFETAKKSLGPLGERIGIMLGSEWLWFDFCVTG